MSELRDRTIAKLRETEMNNFKASNGYRLILVDCGKILMLNAEGGLKVNIREAKEATEEFLNS